MTDQERNRIKNEIIAPRLSDIAEEIGRAIQPIYDKHHLTNPEISIIFTLMIQTLTNGTEEDWNNCVLSQSRLLLATNGEFPASDILMGALAMGYVIMMHSIMTDYEHEGMVQ